MKRLIFLPLLFLTIFCNAQFTKSGGTFLKTGSGFMTATMPADTTTYKGVLGDGYTAAWYIADDASTTTDAQDSVTVWASKIGTGNSLTATDGNGTAPKWYSGDSILFDGVHNRLRDAFTLVQPTSIYLVVKLLVYTNGAKIIDGYGYNGGAFITQNAEPLVSVYAGSSGIVLQNAGFDKLEWHIVRITFYGANSSLQVDDNTKITGDAGTNSMGGLSMGGPGGGTNQSNSNIIVREAIIRSKVDSSSDETLLLNYLNTKYSIF